MSTTLASVLLGVCGMFGWGVYDFLGGVLSRRLGSFVPLVWSQAVGVLTIGVVALAFGATWDVQLRAALLVPLAAALYCGGYLFFFRGFELGNVSIVAATMNLWAVVTMVVAFLFMGQRLTPTQTVGALTIVAGATLASIDWQQVRRSGLQASAGVKETVIGAILFGLYWNVSDLISDDLDWLQTTVLIKIAVVGVLVVLTALTRRPVKVEGVERRTVALLVTMGVVEVGAVGAVNYGLTIGDAILITPIASALSVVTIALAVAVLRERVTRWQAFGMTLAVAGIVGTAF